MPVTFLKVVLSLVHLEKIEVDVYFAYVLDMPIIYLTKNIKKMK